MSNNAKLVAHRQREINAWRKKYLSETTPLRVDGVAGPLFWRAVREVKFHLGYGRKAAANKTYTPQFVRRLRHPHSRKYSSAAMLATGASRRAKRRAWVREQRLHARVVDGVGTFDGKPVAKAAIPFLQYAREHGWQGSLVSGWRSPLYSQSLCRNMCGQNSCPGTCAGTASNHVGSTRGRFAVDVSDYLRFRQIITGVVIDGVSIHNALPRDLVHFSPSGN